MHQLSEDQLRAVMSQARVLVVTAGAGSGKTEVIANRVERIIEESPDEQFRVLAVTYTVKAADELEERLRARVGDSRRVDAETIHSFAHRLIRQHGTWEGLPAEPEVLDRDEDRVELLVTWLTDLGIGVGPNDGMGLLQAIDLARARNGEAVYLSEYRDALASRGCLDYPAMLEVAARLVARGWVRDQLSELYRHLVVDEAQNLSPAQYRFLTGVLGDPPPRVAAMFVGDEKQSIVQFAGADPTLIKVFERDYSAERIRLTRNFRSSAAILHVGALVAAELGDETRDSVVSAAPGQVTVDVFADEREEGKATAAWAATLVEEGLPVAALVDGESRFVSPEEIAVLSRSTAGLRWTAGALDSLGLAYVSSSDPRDWMATQLGQCIVDLIAYRAGPHHPSSQAHLEASAGVPPSAAGTSLVPGFADVASFSSGEEPMSLFDVLADLDADSLEDAWPADRAVLEETWMRFLDRTSPQDRTYSNLQLHIARTQRGELSSPGVRLLTVHKSQGREFRAVAVVGMNQGQFPDFRQQTPAERRAELHCFYVSTSRASRVLRLSRPASRETRFGPRDQEPSEYLRFVGAQ
jgi:DNA helicase-2/ATP-dependent DNA helicase PcrA